MLFPTHVLLGILIFLLARTHLTGNTYLILSLILLGSILPDIDEHKSKITRWSGLLGKIVSFLFKHRGILHSIFTPLIFCSFLGLLWDFDYALALFLGYVGHLFADALTPMGIPIFYPFTPFRLKGPFKTGNISEMTIIVLLILAIIKLI
jgi:inner membrane protein